jgi:hypothetical protein
VSRRRRILVAGAALLAFATLCGAPLGAQASGSSLFIAGVADAETGQPLEDAEVVFIELRRLARANALGEARFDGIPVGAQLVRVRKIGYAPSEVRLNVRGDTSGAVFRLTRSVTQLGAVNVEANMPASLLDFDRRRRRGIGRFLGPEVFDKERDRDFGFLMASRFPGLRVVTNGTGQQIVSMRGTSPCPVRVMVDGIPAGIDDDIWMVKTWDVAAVAYYTGSEIPVEYRAYTRDVCALILVWSKWF